MLDFLTAYIGLGALFLLLEHKNSQLDFEGIPKAEAILTVTAQVIHYIRFWATWPTYMLEDIVIWVSNNLGEEEEE